MIETGKILYVQISCEQKNRGKSKGGGGSGAACEKFVAPLPPGLNPLHSLEFWLVFGVTQ